MGVASQDVRDSLDDLSQEEGISLELANFMGGNQLRGRGSRVTTWKALVGLMMYIGFNLEFKVSLI